MYLQAVSFGLEAVSICFHHMTDHVITTHRLCYQADQPTVWRLFSKFYYSIASGDMSEGFIGKIMKMTDVLVPNKFTVSVRNFFRSCKRPALKNNGLKCRLERMERRMAMLKQKEDSDFIMGTTVRSPANKSKPESENSTPAEKGVKRKGNIETESISKRLALADENDTPCTSSKSHPKHRKRSQLPTQEVSTASPTHTTRQKTTQIQEAIQPPTPRQKSWTITSDNSVSYRKKLLPILKDQKSDNVLRTNEPYFVSHFEPLEEDLSYRKDVVQTEDTQLEVKLPSWRPRKYPSLWVLEGTENLEDEVFVKRHQKLEVEEKRRKRWDLQRLREQKIYEKLKEKEMTAENLKKGEDQHVESFYPLLDDITHIEVCNKIPVMAFGHALPNLKSEEFDLPWEVDASKGPARSSRPGRSR